MLIKKIKTIFIIFLAVSIFAPVYGYFTYNKTCEAFPEQCEGDGDGRSATIPLGKLIVDAAGFYIKSNSDYQLFLKEFELSDIYGTDFESLKAAINEAIENMEAANALYYQIWQSSLNLKYDPFVQFKLRIFNYDAYQTENGLLPAVFGQVSAFLRYGDVKGTYERAYTATGDILERLENIKTIVDKNTLPAISECWRLNQLYFVTELFGQYVSEVFFSI